MSQYITIENFFLKETFSKVVKMSTVSTDGKTTSVVDDALYIIHKYLRGSFSSCSVDGASAMLNHSNTLLMTDHKDALKTGSYPTTSYAGMEWAGVLQKTNIRPP
ncbi:conserved oligomeric Golgi complex subunit 4-like [Dysidea avara]|uniref:conserved oligomeric Golgi complex subunit 4-like n=1 Tax=Dysidea avara TaxID=196820 RepID=UPI003321EF49